MRLCGPSFLVVYRLITVPGSCHAVFRVLGQVEHRPCVFTNGHRAPCRLQGCLGGGQGSGSELLVPSCRMPGDCMTCCCLQLPRATAPTPCTLPPPRPASWHHAECSSLPFTLSPPPTVLRNDLWTTAEAPPSPPLLGPLIESLMGNPGNLCVHVYVPV